MLGDSERESLRLSDIELCGERVDGVLHRVRREDVTVVAGDVSRFEMSLEPSGNRVIANGVARAVALDLHQSDSRLAVSVASKERSHRVSFRGTWYSQMERG